MVVDSPDISRPKTYLSLASIGIAYYVVHHTGFIFLDPVQRIATIWPASGLALGLVLLQPRKLWPHSYVVLALANIISNALNAGTATQTIGFLIASLLE